VGNVKIRHRMNWLNSLNVEQDARASHTFCGNKSKPESDEGYGPSLVTPFDNAECGNASCVLALQIRGTLLGILSLVRTDCCAGKEFQPARVMRRSKTE
jgi:hypothetical protein